MAFGIKKLRVTQIGREATAGTAVAATEIWRGESQIVEDARTRVFATEDIGTLNQQSRFYDAAYLGQMNMPSTPATFEQLVHIFEAGIDTMAAVQDGTGPYVYGPYVLNASANAPKTYTIEGGDNSDVLEMEYSFVTEFVLSGRVDEAVMLDGAAWTGRQATDTTFTSLSTISVEEILFNKCTFYLNDCEDGAGTDVESGSLLAFRLTVRTGWQATRGANGELYFNSIKCIGGEHELELTFEHDALAAGERANMRDGAAQVARLDFEGSAIAGGTTWDGKALRIDSCGVWMPESFRTLSDENGDNIVTGTLKGSYSTTNSMGLALTITNARASV